MLNADIGSLQNKNQVAAGAKKTTKQNKFAKKGETSLSITQTIKKVRHRNDTPVYANEKTKTLDQLKVLMVRLYWYS